MAKKTEVAVVDQTTGEIVETLDADLMAAMEASADTRQTFRAQDVIIPRLSILQDLSPQVKERDAAYVPGAKPGMIFNSGTNTLHQKLTFIPARFSVRWIAWQPRPHGGLVNPDVPEADLEHFEKTDISTWIGRMRYQDKDVNVEIIETPSWAGIMVDEHGNQMPCVIDFPKTKSKAARKINTQIELAEQVTPAGKRYVPASYFHVFTLSTALETSGDNEYFGWVPQRQGLNTDTALWQRAKKLHDQMAAGEVRAADITTQDA
jgi:hypothetical protein